MTEQTAFIISFIPFSIGLIIMRITMSPRYLIPFAFLVGISGILLLILSHQHKHYSLLFFGLAIFGLLAKWYRDWWYRKRRR